MMTILQDWFRCFRMAFSTLSVFMPRSLLINLSSSPKHRQQPVCYGIPRVESKYTGE